MSDEERRGGPGLKLGWNEARTERLLTQVKTRIDQRTRLRRALVASAALASVVGGAAVVFRTAAGTSGPMVADAALPDALVQLAPTSSTASPAPVAAPARATASSHARPRWQHKRARPACVTRWQRQSDPSKLAPTSASRMARAVR